MPPTAVSDNESKALCFNWLTNAFSAGIFDPEAVTDAIFGVAEESISTKPLLNDVQDDIEIKEDIKGLDDDVVDISVPTKNKDYEYYYVYYDEAGNVVEKSPPKTIIHSAVLDDKTQEIPLVYSQDASNALPETGDTPTIYAGMYE